MVKTKRSEVQMPSTFLSSSQLGREEDKPGEQRRALGILAIRLGCYVLLPIKWRGIINPKVNWQFAHNPAPGNRTIGSIEDDGGTQGLDRPHS
jgi:hypothetical protein